MDNIRGLSKLEHNIEETVYEGQVKLGYIKEKVSIYYMKSSLKYLLNIDLEIEDTEILKDNLKNLKEFVKERLGDIKITRNDERFCFSIPESGVEYIYKTNKENTFLKELIQALKNSGCKLEDILNIFRKKSKEIICKKSEGDEFDYVIYFKDESIDIFRYCFTFNELGAYYHRFIPFDYESIL